MSTSHGERSDGARTASRRTLPALVVLALAAALLGVALDGDEPASDRPALATPDAEPTGRHMQLATDTARTGAPATPLLDTVPERAHDAPPAATHDASLHGSVVWDEPPSRDVVPLPDGLRVLAWPLDSPPDAGVARALTPRHVDVSTPVGTSLVMAPVADDGTFDLDGLDHDAFHTVAVLAPGCVTTSLGERWRAGVDEPCVVQIARGFAGTLELREMGGDALRSSALFGRHGLGWDVAGSPRPEVWSADDLELALAGSELRPSTFATRDERLVLATSCSLAASIGPASMSVDIPGYPPTRTTFALAALDHEPTHTVIWLKPVASAFGRVALHLLLPPWGATATGRVHPFASFVLENARGAYVAAAVHEPERDPPPYAGVPQDDYRPRLELRSGFATLTPLEGDDLACGELTELTFDLSALGAVECTVPDASGAPFDGYVVVRVSPAERPQQNRPIHFAHGPYVVEGLPAGRFAFELARPESPAGQARAETDVQPGRLVRVVLAR